jgi:death-on-curing protein
VKRPAFLEFDDVLALHASRIDRYGGTHGVRDAGLLSSALAMPRATFGEEFLHGSLHEMAAANLFHIVKNHPFLDGNTRAGLVVALVFLELNGLRVEATEDELTDLVLSVAEGAASKADIAVFFERVARQS